MRVAWVVARVAFDAAMWVHHATVDAPIIGTLRARAEDIILDTILGPVEESDYRSTTAPSSPPPPRL